MDTTRLFQYISKNKIDVLYEQLYPTRAKFTDVTSKIGILGTNFEFGVKKDNPENFSLVDHTVRVIKALEKQKTFKPLSRNRKLDTMGFYRDISLWHIGLCTFKGVSQIPSKAFFAFKILGNSLLLLVGSPDNLIGTNSVKQTLEVGEKRYSTADFFYDGVYKHIQSCLSYEDYYINPLSTEGVPFSEAERFALELSVFCFLDLEILPTQSLDTAFKVYQQHNLSKLFAKLVENRAHDHRFLTVQLTNNLKKYKYLFVGSPIYTAQM